MEKNAATNEFIDDNADNLDLGDGEEFKESNDHVEGNILVGASVGWRPPGQLESWLGYSPKWNAPKEDDVDIQGGWNLYCFAAKYNTQTHKYIGYFSPCGAKVVPMASGEWAVNCRKFY